MKKVINGTLYDTSRSEYLGGYTAPYLPNDFHYYVEHFYRTKSGKFFLHGKGNAASPYRQQVELNCYGYGAEIRPLTEQQAKEWCAEKLSGECYIEVFGVPEEETYLSFPCPDELKDKLDARADSESTTARHVVLDALQAYLAC